MAQQNLPVNLMGILYEIQFKLPKELHPLLNSNLNPRNDSLESTQSAPCSETF
jgi:hypothetical protein